MADESVYWRKFWQRRLSRRAVLKGTVVGGAGLALAGVVGCGGGDNTSTTTGTSGGSSTPKSSPFIGGRARYTASDPAGDLDAYKKPSFTVQTANGYVYSRLLMSVTAPDDPSTPDIDLARKDWFRPIPDLAESFEQIGTDGLTWSFKLQPGAKWHNLAPVNGRPVVPDDIVKAFDYYKAVRPDKGINLAAIDSVTASGTDTVQLKLKQPFGPLLIMLSSPSDLWIYPPELTDAGQASTKMVGTGPWTFKSYQQGTSMTFDKNPSYWGKDPAGTALPYMAGVDTLFISDKNQEITQYVSGKLDTIPSLPAQLVDSVMSQVGGSILVQTQPNLLYFLFFPPSAFNANKPPFNDVRVRQAVSLALDRDALLDLASSGKGGVWHNLINGGTFWYVDPRDTTAFPEGEFFQHNVQRAQSLLTQAGYANGIDIELHYTNNAYVNAVPDYNPQGEAIPQKLAEAGIRTTLVPHDYQSEWINPTGGIFFGGLNKDNAIAWALESPVPHPWNQFVNQFTANARNHSKINDTEISGLIDQLSRESDFDRGAALALQIQRANAKNMYYVPVVGGFGFAVRQPWFERIYLGPTSYGAGTEQTMWGQIDTSRQPA
jgi:peptide/nickel transport system substrate-binding protein